jgi:uncharacterized membrane protein (UPF0182 family)
MAWRVVAVAIVIVVAGLIALGMLTDVLVDWTWFSAIGYVGVFWTVLGAKLALFFAVFVASAGLLWLNGWLAFRRARTVGGLVPVMVPGPFGGPLPSLPWRLLIAGAATMLGFMIAGGETSHWDTALRFIEQVPYGRNDPVFGTDIGFYLFSLPAFVALKNWLLLILLLSAVFAGAIYWANGAIVLDRRPVRIAAVAIAHGSLLLAGYFAVKAWSYDLDRFLLLYGDNGVVVGAGYTDVTIELPILWLQAGVAGAAALAAATNVWLRSAKLPLVAVAVLIGSSFGLALLFPGLFQRLYVKPNELQLEAPFIARNIAATQEAYNLRQVAIKPFPAAQGLTAQSLQDNRATVDNIRLWDWQPLMDSYRQLQEIRTYYKFHDVDVDRYALDGTYRQVMLSARELDPALLASNAQTWVNLHLLFTHGNGVVMSPVTQKSTEGLPLFYLQDIPPAATGGPPVREPRIYFGQGTDSYAIVKGSVPEFDYPKGKDNVYAAYDGADGVPIGSFARRSLYAWYFGDLNILLSGYVTDQSRILFRRNIQQRVRAIAPFLQLDKDPYLVIADGRLFWLQDAYTTSDWFPYAQPVPGGGINYIRNSVKIVIDAYQGTVDFYLADPADPIAATYGRIFPGLFKPFTAMPAELQRHVRYPEDLFLAQAQMYRAYHMDAPEVFYNREDLWQFPRQPSNADGPEPTARTVPAAAGYPGTLVAGSSARMAPYYIVMRLPGEPRAEFFLMLPMVPNQRENMIAWLAARCDAPDYGKLIVYEFPKDKLVYGPAQIEARINQNTDISQQISLWNQQGSRVIRGNILVIPIEDSILYVSPLYLRAETGQLPELKRVIAAYGDHVVMEETLGGALAALFKDAAPSLSPATAQTGRAPAGGADTRAREALQHYDRAIERLKAGDWPGFGAELDALRPLLEALGRP